MADKKLTLLLELFAVHELGGQVLEEDRNEADRAGVVGDGHEGGLNRSPSRPLGGVFWLVPERRQRHRLARESAPDAGGQAIHGLGFVFEDVVIGRRLAPEELEKRFIHQQRAPGSVIDLEPHRRAREEALEQRDGILETRQRRMQTIEVGRLQSPYLLLLVRRGANQLGIEANGALRSFTEVSEVEALVFRVRVGVGVFHADEQRRDAAELAANGSTNGIDPPQPMLTGSFP